VIEPVTKEEVRGKAGERIAQVWGNRLWIVARGALFAIRIFIRGRGRVYDGQSLKRLGRPVGLGEGALAACEREHDRGTRDRVEPDSQGEDTRRRADQIQRGSECNANDTEDERSNT